MIKHEIKSQLAKLLATEDLVVEHRKVETASFNVHTRVLTLPMWQKASNIVYDMLVGHEVGHALYTPNVELRDYCKAPMNFFNIVEDPRIEKLMKRKYPGLLKSFYGGYKEIHEQDFFNLEGEDIESMTIADRANLHFKVGNFVDIPIKDHEQYVIDMIADAESVEDAYRAAEELYNLCLKELKGNNKNETDLQSDQQMEVQSGPGGQDDIMVDPDDVPEELREEEKETLNPIDSSEGDDETESVDEHNPEVKTAKSLSDAIQNLVDDGIAENVYVEIPKLDLKNVIAPNEEVHELIENHWKIFGGDIEDDCFKWVDQRYNTMKKNSQKEVNYLVKEFECKKAADSYARATTARTGVLDCSKLHTYKYNEDLFKKVTTLADGKNHGLIFILDWSGSMGSVLLDTLKQLYNILWFCKKVGIPFDVYAFTMEWKSAKYGRTHEINDIPTEAYAKEEGKLVVGKDFSLMNIFTSKVRASDMDNQMRNIYRVASSIVSYNCIYSTPHGLSLSGTPLNESLIALHEIIPQFKMQNKVQKIQCVILTDGEAAHLPYHVVIRRYWEKNESPAEPFIGCRRVGKSFLRNRKTGTVRKLTTNYSYNEFTDNLLYDLRDTFKEVNFIGIRVLSPRDASSFIRMNSDTNEIYESTMRTWKKERSFSIDQSGYHKYFGMSSTMISNEVEFEVADNASKSTIRSAFKKSLKTKKMNKRFLSEFVELVA